MKNGQKMAEIKNPFKFLLLTHFAPYMPKIMGFGQKMKKCYHNCPTQQYMTGPLYVIICNYKSCINCCIEFEINLNIL